MVAGLADRSLRSARVRTGCRQCRSRRRKCDEQKPQCRNCTSRGTECQYGPRLKFLDKNAFTIRNTVESPSPAPVHEEGEEVQIVNESVPQTPDESSSITHQRGILGKLAGRSNVSRRTRREIDVSSELQSPGEIRHLDHSITPQRPNQYWDSKGKQRQRNSLGSAKSANTGPSPGDGQSSAVQGLLALGLTTPLPHTPLTRSQLHDSGIISSSNILHDWTIGSLDHNLDNSPHASQIKAVDVSSPDKLSEDQLEELRLLRCYRYDVATWLDICDVNMSFGVAAIHLALGAAPFGPLPDRKVLALITSLTRSSLPLQLVRNVEDMSSFPSGGTPITNHLNFSTMTSTTTPTERFPETNSLETDKSFLSQVVSAALERVNLALSDIEKFWTTTATSVDHLSLVGSLVPYTSQLGLKSATFWLLLRLDLSIGLTNPSFDHAALSMAFALQKLDIGDVGFDDHFAHVPLVLCAQAIVLCNSMSNLRQSSAKTADLWAELTTKLNQWYQGRKGEYEPMLDLDYAQSGLESSFPVILFTNGQAIFGNQLYHTAMHLLLQHKPRTSQMNHVFPQARSLLWHSRRICGISLHNDRRQCWDLSLLASFFAVSKTMTYRPQQSEVIGGFRRIVEITGWNVNNLVVKLQVEWASMDEP